MKFGVQLFGVSNAWRDNPKKFFRSLNEMGYDIAEPCIIVGTSDNDDPAGFWKPEETEFFMSYLEQAGLYAVSCHLFIKETAWKNVYEFLVPVFKKLCMRYGIRQFVLGCPESATQKAYNNYAKRLCSLASLIQEQECELLLHNGPAEFQTKWNGQTAYEYLLNACKGMVYAQPDIGWIQYSGDNPAIFLKQNRSRIHSLHYKDLKSNYSALPTNCCDIGVGMGCVDIKTCHLLTKNLNISHIIDQDRSDGDIIDDLEQALKLLLSL